MLHMGLPLRGGMQPLLFGFAAPPTPRVQPRVEIIEHRGSPAQQEYNAARGYADGATSTFHMRAAPVKEIFFIISVIVRRWRRWRSCVRRDQERSLFLPAQRTCG